MWHMSFLIYRYNQSDSGTEKSHQVLPGIFLHFYRDFGNIFSNIDNFPHCIQRHNDIYVRIFPFRVVFPGYTLPGYRENV